jgi:multidrug efflux pump subunit AcrA (membrane-fusion protein)
MVLLLLALAGCGGRPDAGDGEQDAATGAPPAVAEVDGEARIVLDSATVQRLGLETAPLAALTRAPDRELPAVIVEDPAAGATVRSGIAGRLAGAGAGAEWPGVGARLTEGSVIAQVGDARPITVPRSGTVVRVLAQPGELVQAGQPLLELADYSTALARVAWEEGTPPSSLGFTTASGGRRLGGALLGAAPEADPLTRAPAWLYRVTGGTALRPGALLTAFAPQPAARRGVLVPGAAVVQWDALAWCYLERAPGQYLRVRVGTEHPVPGGWLVERGLSPGERVVVTGAGLLLSEEFRARIVVGEEVGE